MANLDSCANPVREANLGDALQKADASLVEAVAIRGQLEEVMELLQGKEASTGENSANMPTPSGLVPALNQRLGILRTIHGDIRQLSNRIVNALADLPPKSKQSAAENTLAGLQQDKYANYKPRW